MYVTLILFYMKIYPVKLFAVKFPIKCLQFKTPSFLFSVLCEQDFNGTVRCLNCSTGYEGDTCER